MFITSRFIIAANPIGQSGNAPNQGYSRFTGSKLKPRISAENYYLYLQSLTDAQKKVVRGIGFGSVLGLQIRNIPTALGYWLVTNYDDRTSFLFSETNQLEITPEEVHRLLGLPAGARVIPEIGRARSSDPVVIEWRGQFGGSSKVSPRELMTYLIGRTDTGRLFVLNFLVMFCSMMIETTKNNSVNQRFLPCVSDISTISDMDWCTYIVNGLKHTKRNWNGIDTYSGSLIVLALGMATLMDPKPLNGRYAIEMYDNQQLDMMETRLETVNFVKNLKCETTVNDDEVADELDGDEYGGEQVGVKGDEFCPNTEIIPRDDTNAILNYPSYETFLGEEEAAYKQLGEGDDLCPNSQLVVYTGDPYNDEIPFVDRVSPGRDEETAGTGECSGADNAEQPQETEEEVSR